MADDADGTAVKPVPESPEPAADAGAVMRSCPNCGAALRESRCKLVCPGCHYYMSCSDYL
jgi:uncharacterized Zn finger protein (UPF0148 family)